MRCALCHFDSCVQCWYEPIEDEMEGDLMDKYHVGQRVRLIYPGEFYGELATIVSEKYDATDYRDGAVMKDSYEIDIDGVGSQDLEDDAWWVEEERYLEPLNDGDFRASWEDCAWSPQTVEVCR